MTDNYLNPLGRGAGWGIWLVNIFINQCFKNFVVMQEFPRELVKTALGSRPRDSPQWVWSWPSHWQSSPQFWTTVLRVVPRPRSGEKEEEEGKIPYSNDVILEDRAQSDMFADN